MSFEIKEKWSNDSAIYSEDANSDVTNTNSEIKSNIGSEPGDEDSYSVISLDQICKQDTSKSASNDGKGDTLGETRISLIEKTSSSGTPVEWNKMLVALNTESDGEKLVKGTRRWLSIVTKQAPLAHVGTGAPSRQVCLTSRVEVRPQTEIYKSCTPNSGDAERCRSQSS